MGSEAIQAIDVHGHYGRYDRGQADVINDFMSANGAEVVRRARLANTRLTIVSPLTALLPRFHGDAADGTQVVARRLRPAR